MSVPQQSRPRPASRTRSRGLSPSTRLALRFDPREPLSDRLLLLLSSANSDLRLERTAEGELIIMSPAGANTGRLNLKISSRLYTWTEGAGKGLGIAFDSSAGFHLPNSAVRAPDASWVTLDRWNSLTPDEQKRYAPLCPDFVVELRSPSDHLADHLADVRAKMREYINQGVRLGWLIDPQRNTVEIYRPRRPVETLEAPASLSGEDVLPGFVLDLSGILSP